MGENARPGSIAVSPSTLAAPTELPSTEHPPCVLINPRSFSASRRGLAERAARLASSHGAEVIRATDTEEIDAAVDLMLARQQRLVVLLAGDGTLRAVADRFASMPGNVPRPQLFVLGGGRTNLTAGELGGTRGVLLKLGAALQRWRARIPFATEERYVLEIVQPPAPPRRGFFVAAGLVDYAIRACHRDRLKGSGALRQGAVGTARTLLRFVLSDMGGRLDPLLDELRIEVPGGETLVSAARFLVVTTLQRRQGALDPYAERGQGAVRFTAIAAGGVGFWLRVPWIAAGRFGPGTDPSQGYLSGRCDALRVRGLASYTLDGEEYDADPSRPVLIRQGPPLTFATL